MLVLVCVLVPVELDETARFAAKGIAPWNTAHGGSPERDMSEEVQFGVRGGDGLLGPTVTCQEEMRIVGDNNICSSPSTLEYSAAGCTLLPEKQRGGGGLVVWFGPPWTAYATCIDRETTKVVKKAMDVMGIEQRRQDHPGGNKPQLSHVAMTWGVFFSTGLQDRPMCAVHETF